MYFAILQRSLVRPFDATCNVAAHPAGEAMIKDVMRDWRASEFHYAWVYPHEGEYVLSNDYVIWAAAERSQVDHLPCWVLGFPTLKEVVGVSGPLEPSVVPLESGSLNLREDADLSGCPRRNDEKATTGRG